MTPQVRGRILGEIESTGRAKRSFDVLLWLPRLDRKHLEALIDVGILQDYLNSLVPYVCGINLRLPRAFNSAADVLTKHEIPFSCTDLVKPEEAVANAFGSQAPSGLVAAVATALQYDTDIIVTGETDWFPYWRELQKLNVLATDSGTLKRQCEVFVRGHDVPWSFDYMVWCQPWTTFYTITEQRSFHVGLSFLEYCYRKNLNVDVQETGRMLVYNRLPNLCFTRDRLLFLEQQQSVAKRAKWKHQTFAFEVGYFLNFYYLLIFGGFDHIALILNYALKLRLGEKQVGATYQSFLNALENAAPEIHALFVDPGLVAFLERIAAFRHFAAHRGSIMPGKVYKKPEVEPTVEELDAEITKRDLDRDIALFPPGPARESVRETLRYRVRLEKSEELLDGVVFVDIKGKPGFVNPMNDIEWNFNKFNSFMVKVLEACKQRI
jgi:hypothetical protein